MATIEGAAMTWQLTKSERKRTYNKKRDGVKGETVSRQH